MPQKRNPVAAAVVLAAAQRMPGLVSTVLSAMVQEQERGLGGWHAEWETIQEVVELTAGALHHLADAVGGLDVRTDKMRENLDATHGLIFAEAVQMALADTIGLAEAHELVAEASKRAASEGRHLRDVLASDSRVTAEIPARQLERLFDPDAYLGVANQFIDLVMATHAGIQSNADGK
jgi:3-carboxy-cis,cis-muconate cycloisomerase